MDEMKTEMISLFLWDGMTLEEMCDCESLLNAYGVLVDWDSMEDVVEGYTVDAEWTHSVDDGRDWLEGMISCEFGGAIRLMEDDS